MNMILLSFNWYLFLTTLGIYFYLCGEDRISFRWVGGIIGILLGMWIFGTICLIAWIWDAFDKLSGVIDRSAKAYNLKMRGKTIFDKWDSL